MTDLTALTKPLPIDQVDFRVQSINKGGYALILAYKDARVDIRRLNEVVGPLGWKREHSRDNHNCTVSIWDSEHKQWVSKEDTGVESNTEQEKGLASDSFKRACFNWGIGLELYDYPDINVKLNDDEWKLENDKPKATWKLAIKEWVWKSAFDDDGNIVYLAAKDKTVVRFEWRKTEAAIKPEPSFIDVQQCKIILDALVRAEYPLENFLAKAGIKFLDHLPAARFQGALTHIQAVAAGE